MNTNKNTVNSSWVKRVGRFRGNAERDLTLRNYVFRSPFCTNLLSLLIFTNIILVNRGLILQIRKVQKLYLLLSPFCSRCLTTLTYKKALLLNSRSFLLQSLLRIVYCFSTRLSPASGLTSNSTSSVQSKTVYTYVSVVW